MPTARSHSGAAQFAPPGLSPQRLEDRIAVLADLCIDDLRRAWLETWSAAPPKGARRRLLVLGIAWKWQANRHGGHAPEVARRLAALGAGVGSAGSSTTVRPTQSRRLMPGVRLLRTWKGERHEVHVVEGGFLWRGRTWGSLSAIAREIAGGRRNGPAFFGLRQGDAP